ncbi:MAG: serine hydrolase [Elusimicrobiota bacterium]
MRRVFKTLLTLAAFFCAITSARAAGARYDVSYLWHGKLASVAAYRGKIGRVLGPEVADRLRIVRGPKNYGLIYHRRGNGAGAAKVAKAHAKLLRSRGLEEASAIRSRDWTFVSGDGRELRPSATETAQARRDRDEEVHDLETAVEAYIKRLRHKGRVASDERTAWSVYDFTTGEKLVDINEDLQLQAASLVKPFFALAFFHEVERGELIYGSKSRRHMERMIQRSDNRSTNWIIRHVGGPKAMQRILAGHYGNIFRDVRIVEYVPAGGRTYRNKASARDYSRFLYALYKGQIPRAAEIKRLMSLPNRDRIYTGASEVPKGTKVYDKTGSTARLCGDMGILIVRGADGERYPYTIIGVIEKRQPARDYLAWIQSRGDVIRDVSNIVYQAISRRHGLSAGSGVAATR